MIDSKELTLLRDALATLAEGYSELPDFQADYDAEAAATVVQNVATRMHDNYPYYNPQYAGQMLKPPHPIARLACAMSLWVAGRLHPGKRVVASGQAHYTHGRISEFLGLPFAPIAVDSDGRMDMQALEAELKIA